MGFFFMFCWLSFDTLLFLIFFCLFDATGSNSVNVFLGLGLPWVISSLYHKARGTRFMVNRFNLTFSVTVFISCAFGAIILLTVRRRVSDKKAKQVCTFVCSWLCEMCDSLADPFASELSLSLSLSLSLHLSLSLSLSINISLSLSLLV